MNLINENVKVDLLDVFTVIAIVAIKKDDFITSLNRAGSSFYGNGR